MLRTHHRPRLPAGFTLIELLIVVAIIGILAVVAVPNFLVAQTRARVSRVAADMQALATGLELYATDHNHYPYFDAWGLNPRYNEISYRLIPLTTPVAYVPSVDFRDPFLGGNDDRGYGDGLPRTHYNYRNHEVWKSGNHPWKKIPVWVLNSIGPDQYPNQGLLTEMWAQGLLADGIVTLYEPSNGVVSAGDIPRTGGSTRYRRHR